MIKGNINIKAITNILIENERRNSIIYAKFNPITGEGSVGGRVKCTISDFPIRLYVNLWKQVLLPNSLRITWE